MKNFKGEFITKSKYKIITLSILLICMGGQTVSWVREIYKNQEIRVLSEEKSADEKKELSITRKFTSLYAENADIAGYLKIEGTNINHPVIYTPQDGEYYLDKDFNRNADKNGTLFVDKGSNPFIPSTNILIHGHNMKNGHMFATLPKYKDEKYWREHPYINFDTIYKDGEYQVIAAFYSQVYKKSDEVFKYYKFFNANTESEFEYFVNNIQKLSLYNTGVQAVYGDTFITLSTCSYHVENGRFVVVAKRVLKK